MHPRGDTGQLVEVRGQRWLLTRTDIFDRCRVLTLEGRDRANDRQRFRVVDPFDEVRFARRRALRVSDLHTARCAALQAIVASNPPGRVWTAAAASIDVLPYQLAPALSVLNGTTRVLLADAVGLGKTIQAGLILSELRERGWVRHALIVCPAGLRHGWARELRERFSIDAAVVDQAAIAERVAALPPGVNPWTGGGVTIASIDFVKRPEVQSAVAGIPIDLLIADEAHHLSPGTDRAAGIAALASRVPWCVFASATPHSGDEVAYTFLTSLGSTGEPIVVFRRSRADAGIRVERRSHVLTVSPDQRERELNAVIDEYARALWREHDGDRWTTLLAMTIARRAASSAAALCRTLERRVLSLQGGATHEMQAELPWEDEETADFVEADPVLAAKGLRNANTERRLLERALLLAGACGPGTKLRRIRRLVERIAEPLIVFTEYRDTVFAIVAALDRAARVVAIHGGMTAGERQEAVDRFNGGSADVMVATDAAGEGVNLHYRCRLVVDMELPWNPLRLEQRVGRVDRIGQCRTVHAIHLCHADSIEARVRDRLRLRARRAADAFGCGESEHDVADTVLGGAIELRPAPQPRNSIEGAVPVDEIERIALQRRWLNRMPQIDAGILVRSPAQRFIAVTRTTLASGGDCIRAYRVRLSSTPSTRQEWRGAWQQLLPLLDKRRAGPFDRATRDSIARRINAICARLARDQRRSYQRSLFDARADDLANQRHADHDALVKALGEALAAVAPEGADEVARTELVAAWPEPAS